MEILLTRFSYSPTETEGYLEVPGLDPMFTMERPWLNNKRGVSCIPDGEYKLRPHVRPSGDKVYILSNSLKYIYETDDDIPPEGYGRTLILIHKANFVEDLAGCIAPGLGRRDCPGWPEARS